MKKVSILISIFVIAFIFVACGGDDRGQETSDAPVESLLEAEQTQDTLSAFEMYLQAAKALETAESMRMLTISNASIHLDGFFTEMVTRSYIDQIIHSPTEIDMRMDTTTTIDNEEILAISYFRGNTFYILSDTPGEGYKLSLSLEEVIQIAGTEIVAFDESAIINQEVTTLPNGTNLAFTLNSDTMSETVEAMSEVLFVMFSGMLGDIDIEISDIDTHIVLNTHNEIESISMTLALDVESLGLSLQSNINTEILQIGGVSIDFPDFLEDFFDI